MKVVYRGPNPLAYHSSPSGFNYLFDPGVAQVVKKEDQKFFKNIIAIESNHFENGGWKNKIKLETNIEPETKGGKR